MDERRGGVALPCGMRAGTDLGRTISWTICKAKGYNCSSFRTERANPFRVRNATAPVLYGTERCLHVVL